MNSKKYLVVQESKNGVTTTGSFGVKIPVYKDTVLIQVFLLEPISVIIKKP